MTIEGIPEGWELVRVGHPVIEVEWVLNHYGDPILFSGNPNVNPGSNWPIIRKIEKPKQYRPFANAAEYMARDSADIAVDWKGNDSPCFCAVVSVNDGYVWVAFGSDIERFTWPDAFERIQFRSKSNTTSPFGVEVTS